MTGVIGSRSVASRTCAVDCSPSVMVTAATTVRISGTIPAVATSFANPSGTTGNGTDMIYEFGQIGTLGGGRNQILFFPNLVGNYDWL